MHVAWTPAVIRAFEAAQLLARRHGAAAVQLEHLLHALLLEDAGRPAALLTAAGADLAAARRALAERPPVGAPQPNETPLPFDRDTQAILDEAHDLAGGLTIEGAVPSEAVLLAMLRRVAELRRLLVAVGLDFVRLEASVRAVQGPPLELDEPLDLGEPTEQIDLARILDAAANRAREALRTIEDYCRFVLDDAVLSRELKQLRHDLAAALDTFGPDPVHLLAARETLRDVGTTLSTPRELERASARDVVQVNLKRLQEALRSLEEFGKVHRTELGQVMEQLRYRGYTLERALLLGGIARQRLAESRLCVLVTGSLCAAALDWTIQEAAAGGADMIQLREKKLDDRALLERARQVRRWTRQAGVLFILNDRPDVARLVEADGVHLGQDDMPVKDARRILGPEALIGISTHNLEQVRQAVLDGASYLGVGPTLPSGTKTFTEFPGLDFVRQAMAETSLPAFAIGGVNLETIGAVVAAGARRVAVSQAICQAQEPQQVAAELRRALTGA